MFQRLDFVEPPTTTTPNLAPSSAKRPREEEQHHFMVDGNPPPVAELLLVVQRLKSVFSKILTTVGDKESPTLVLEELGVLVGQLQQMVRSKCPQVVRMELIQHLRHEVADRQAMVLSMRSACAVAITASRHL